MTLTADQANQFTLDTIVKNTDSDLTTELQLAEQQIRQRIRAEFFTLAFNATIIGNPSGDPSDDSNLTPSQILFRDHWTDDGYKVSISIVNGSGFWFLNWADVGTELLTSLYSIRTTVTPGAIEQQTIDSIDNFFDSLPLRATSLTTLVPFSGGDIDENDFGAPSSTFYEYTSLVNQQDDTDYTTELKTALRASGLGYVDDNRITGVGGATNTTSNTNTLDVSDGTTTVTVTVGGTGTAVDLVAAINANSTLQAINIVGDINGPDVLIVNTLAGTLIATNNVGDVLGDIFGLGSPENGVITDNTEVYKLA
jgi:hypothetical protein